MKYPTAPSVTINSIPKAPPNTATILITGLVPDSVGVAVGVVVDCSVVPDTNNNNNNNNNNIND